MVQCTICPAFYLLWSAGAYLRACGTQQDSLSLTSYPYIDITVMTKISIVPSILVSTDLKLLFALSLDITF